MNFQAIRQIKGQMDGNFPAKIEMFGTFTEIGGTAFTNNQKPYCKCKITDDTGESHNVQLFGDAPPTNLLGTKQSFSLSAYDGNYQGKQYVGYSGFWNDRVPQQAAQTPPQSYQHAAQGNKSSSDDVTITQILLCVERIATALERIADNGQSFEKKYNLGEGTSKGEDDIPL